MATNVREARRRKIVDRGSDRLALITGRSQTLPPHAPSPPSSSSNPQPGIQDAQPSDSVHQDPKTHAAEKTTAILADNPCLYAVSPNGEDEASDFELPKHYTTPDAVQTGDDFGGSSSASQLRKFETKAEASRAPASEICEVKPSLASSTDQNSSVSTLATDRRTEPLKQQFRVFTPKQISTAVVETARTRLCCSIAVGLLVVISFLGYEILGSNIVKSILSFRPFYIVLLSNVTFVLAQLLGKQKSSGRTDGGENKTTLADGLEWAEQLGNALELGLLMQQVFNAVFMDFAVYAIIIVCGLSFVQQFR
ncbi:hypothetical protein FEM48_Zijuj06G0096900 [Ziziphus jujuba var. spinosa]|uniref:Uncharacterized protein n=1 Tax=Ziziphus jujuba var. spinosa TaxID=714518 RepID=A0A978V8J2_ZIZJJ|nr:hypothetical protein FEM48_Zijuj06G0096900 [Ziziphus jujuba var. spinosa]